MDIEEKLKIQKNVREDITKRIQHYIGRYAFSEPCTQGYWSQQAWDAAIRKAVSIAKDDSDLYLMGSSVREIGRHNRTVDESDDDSTSVWGGAGPDCITEPEGVRL